MVIRSDYYSRKAQELHERERDIKAARGRILDCDGVVLADNRPVCTVSVIHSQITDPEGVIHMLTESGDLGRDRQKKSGNSLPKGETNVDKETGDRIRATG